MFGNNQVCCLCASECGIRGCICNGTIQLLGNNCLAHHLNESEVDHNLVDLDLALKMQDDPSLIRSYIRKLPRLHRAIGFLRKSSESIEECKILLQDSKKRLISHIEEVFASLEGAIEEFGSEVDRKLKCLSKYKANLCDEGRVLMEEYKAKRSKGFLRNSIKSMEIPIDEICNFITQSIKLDTTIQDSKSYHINPKQVFRSTTYTIKHKSKELIKYDSDTDTITTYNLNKLPFKLYYATTTMLFDGSIIIAGLE
jgi:hypothetical protein